MMMEEHGKAGRPDVERLRDLIDAGCYAKGLLYEGRPAHRRVGLAVGYLESLVHGWLFQNKKPHRDSLLAVADLFAGAHHVGLAAGFPADLEDRMHSELVRRIQDLTAHLTDKERDAVLEEVRKAARQGDEE